MPLLNIAWPALYFVRGWWGSWYAIALALLIEIILVKYLLSVPPWKSALSTVLANTASSVAGIYIVMLGMFHYWHPQMDQFMPNATFDLRNWIATWFFMWLASWMIELFVYKLFFWRSQPLLRLMWVIALTNLVSYLATIFIIDYH